MILYKHLKKSAVERLAGNPSLRASPLSAFNDEFELFPDVVGDKEIAGPYVENLKKIIEYKLQSRFAGSILPLLFTIPSDELLNLAGLQHLRNDYVYVDLIDKESKYIWTNSDGKRKAEYSCDEEVHYKRNELLWYCIEEGYLDAYMSSDEFLRDVARAVFSQRYLVICGSSTIENLSYFYNPGNNNEYSDGVAIKIKIADSIKNNTKPGFIAGMVNYVNDNSESNINNLSGTERLLRRAFIKKGYGYNRRTGGISQWSDERELRIIVDLHELEVKRKSVNLISILDLISTDEHNYKRMRGKDGEVSIISYLTGKPDLDFDKEINLLNLATGNDSAYLLAIYHNEMVKNRVIPRNLGPEFSDFIINIQDTNVSLVNIYNESGKIIADIPLAAKLNRGRKQRCDLGTRFELTKYKIEEFLNYIYLIDFSINKETPLSVYEKEKINHLLKKITNAGFDVNFFFECFKHENIGRYNNLIYDESPMVGRRIGKIIGDLDFFNCDPSDPIERRLGEEYFKLKYHEGDYIMPYHRKLFDAIMLRKKNHANVSNMSYTPSMME